jgi:hypothetical protein
VKFAQGLGVDAVCVLVFAIIGRSSHAETNDLIGVATTAWPFLAGAVLGYLLDGVRRRAARVDPVRQGPSAVPTGVTVWVSTVAVGMVLRVLVADGGAPVSFVLVASIALGVLLLGWRGGLAAIRRARRTRSRPTPTGTPAP